MKMGETTRRKKRFTHELVVEDVALMVNSGD
jgi:hypothetical protein